MFVNVIICPLSKIKISEHKASTQEIIIKSLDSLFCLIWAVKKCEKFSLLDRNEIVFFTGGGSGI
jgi:hypothetical protein